MKTGLEKMRSSELYTFADPEVDASARHAKASCARLQTITVYDDDYRQVMEELIPHFPKTSTIYPPFVCDYGTAL